MHRDTPKSLTEHVSRITLAEMMTASLAALMATLPSVAAADATAHWVYASEPGAASDAHAQRATWGAASATCIDGISQSPIDIVTSDVAPARILTGALSPSLSGEFIPTHSGHAFQLTAAPGQTIKGRIGKLQYSFVQVHWHTPSENTIDGAHAALEGHFVHQYVSGGATYLAVLAVLYDLSDDCNEGLEQFWPDFPIDAAQAAEPISGLDLGPMVEPLLEDGYYHWTGSLTTPPCTEGVDWNLFKRRATVCQKQVDRLKRALANTQSGVDINNRVTNPLNHRVVSEVPTGPFASVDCTAFVSYSAGGLAGVVGITALLLGLHLWYGRNGRSDKGDDPLLGDDVPYEQHAKP